MIKSIIIDSDQHVRSEIKKIILQLDESAEVAEFSDSKDISLKNISQEEIQKLKNSNLIIISLNETAEWKEILSAGFSQDLMLSEFKNKVSIVITSFTPEKFDREHTVKTGAVNILHKPLDIITAKETVNAAFFENKILKPSELAVQKPVAFAAMVKNISAISICELGFVTLNDSPIPVNSISKYFKDIFSFGKRQSVWAQCLLSLEIPDQPGTYINKFQFLGIDQAQLMNIRRYVSNNRNQRIANSVWNLDFSGVEKAVKIALIGNGDQLQRNLKHDLEVHFHNIEIDYLQINRDHIMTQFSTRYDCVISLCDDVEFETLKAHFLHESVFLLIASKILPEERIELLIHQYKNIFTHPFDRAYFFKVLRILVKSLKFSEIPELYNLSYNEILKAVNLVKIDEVCESFVSFNYHRELPHGTFREIALIAEDEHDYIEIPAYCRFSQKIKNPTPIQTQIHKKLNLEGRQATHMHQFLFWGLSDQYLKHLRRWLLHNYVLKNQKT